MTREGYLQTLQELNRLQERVEELATELISAGTDSTNIYRQLSSQVSDNIAEIHKLVTTNTPEGVSDADIDSCNVMI
jgi:archaellum component FlaC